MENQRGAARRDCKCLSNDAGSRYSIRKLPAASVIAAASRAVTFAPAIGRPVSAAVTVPEIANDSGSVKVGVDSFGLPSPESRIRIVPGQPKIHPGRWWNTMYGNLSTIIGN